MFLEKEKGKVRRNGRAFKIVIGFFRAIRSLKKVAYLIFQKK